MSQQSQSAFDSRSHTPQHQEQYDQESLFGVPQRPYGDPDVLFDDNFGLDMNHLAAWDVPQALDFNSPLQQIFSPSPPFEIEPALQRVPSRSPIYFNLPSSPPPPPNQHRAESVSRRLSINQRLRPDTLAHARESIEPLFSNPSADYEYNSTPEPEANATALSRAATSRPGTSHSAVVDLTNSPPPETAPSSRNANTNTHGKRQIRALSNDLQVLDSGPKRARVGSKSESKVQKKEFEHADVVDLLDIDSHESYEAIKAKEHANIIARQKLEEANRPVKLSDFQCIICLDSPTDLTTTHCGHLFCSECLFQSLTAGTGRKCCPVCRSAIVNTQPGKKPAKNGLFPLEMKFMTENKKGKQPAVRC
ncbi:hypothetical protein BJ878DRAFT_544589 [Calycina marina]|uniref:RING-type domain-containing protein n=1 Tax=Calycina marina TaxID=1763456 RepID=A0A9P7YYJ9_9HELO|nr:hypothetical protein BJ878DRAFT_544589 [Calycina marina]